MFYSADFSVFMVDGHVQELRFEGPTDYVFREALRVGSSLDDALKVMGQPSKTIEGQKNAFEEGVLYKDIDGRKGYCYYGRPAEGVRIFVMDYKVLALYVTRKGPAAPKTKQ
jgi:hypothetical protein